MKKENKQGLYTSPEVEVMEIRARQMMCASPTTEELGSWGYDDDEL